MSQLLLSRRVSSPLTRAPQRQCKVSALPWASGSDRASAPQATQTVPVSAQDKGPGDELSHATEVLTKAASYDIQTPPMQWAITKSQLAVAKETLAEMKRHTLQWAITHAELGTFEFHDKGSKQRSTDLVKLVLLTFMTDAGFQIPSGYSLNSSRNPTDQERQAFHSALAQHIHQLTGVKPRIVKQSSGTGAEAADQYVIYRV